MKIRSISRIGVRLAACAGWALAVSSGRCAEGTDSQGWGTTPLGAAIPAGAPLPPKVNRGLPDFFSAAEDEGPAFLASAQELEGAVIALAVSADNPAGRDAAGRACQLLQASLESVTGIKVPAVDESAIRREEDVDGSVRFLGPDGKAVQKLIWVGNSAAAQRQGITASDLPPGGYRMATTPEGLILTGNDSGDTGTYFAALALLERLGFRWLWPGPLGTVLPSRDAFRVPRFRQQDAPALACRRIRAQSFIPGRSDLGLALLGMDEASYKRNYETAGDWLLLQRLGGDASILGGHAFDDWHSRYGQTHPEWFALQPDGTREQIGGRARLCDANEDLAAEVAKDRLKYAEAHPGAYIPMAPNDGGATNFFCMCPECRKLDPANGPAIELLFGTGPGRSERFMGRYVSLTDRHVTFWNRVAAKVLAVKPTARFTTYAYSAYRDAPLGAPIHPAYSVGFVGLTYLHDGIRKEDLARWDGWAAQSSSLYLRPNLLLQGISYPYNYVGEMARDLAHCYRTGLIGADFDCITHDWATRGLVYYALARLLWNPGLSGTDIVDDYCRTGFGPAAEPVKKYFAELEQATRDMARLSAETETPASGQAREEEIGAPVLTARERMERSLPQAFHAARLDRMTSLLDEAREIARNDPTIGQRVDFLAVGLEYARLQTATYQAQQAGEDPRPALEALREFLRETAEKQPLAINTAYLLYEQNARFRILQ